MIDREKLAYYSNILNVDKNNNVNVNDLAEVLTLMKKYNDTDFMKKILTMANGEIDFSFLDKVFDVIKNNPRLEEQLLDSFSDNQISAKTALLNAVDNLDILTEDSTVVIMAGWFGSVLVPKLANRVKKIVNIDMDEDTTKIAKNHLMTEYTNVEHVCDDVFKTYRDVYLDTNLIINTSCEHMPPMKEWPWFAFSSVDGDAIDVRYKRENLSRKKVFVSPKLSNNCYFAFQSNNMFGIEGHVNCVNSLEEFKDQMPERAEILFEEEVEDTRGTRYMLVGKLNPL